MKSGYYINNNFVEKDFDFKNLEYYCKLKDVLKVKCEQDYNFIRIGTPDGDGGYFMVNDFGKGKIAYSFGINDNADWENDIANLGYDVFMYDHTIDKLPLENKNFHFFKEGISAVDSPKSPLKTLKYYINRNNHSDKNHMILKLDVEGYEWGVLETTSSDTLEKFDQIVVEFHNLLSGDEKFIDILKKLNNTHRLVYLNKNPFGISVKIENDTFHNVLEATYINKKSFS